MSMNVRRGDGGEVKVKGESDDCPLVPWRRMGDGGKIDSGLGMMG